MAAGRTTLEPHRHLVPQDYSMKEKLTLVARRGAGPRKCAQTSFGRAATGRSSGPEDDSVRLVDYAPMVFRKLREHFGIDSRSYMRSIGPEQMLSNLFLGDLSSLSELSSEGKSGSFFYYTADTKYMVKTISKAEHKFLREILGRYYSHMVSNPASLLCRFYGSAHDSELESQQRCARRSEGLLRRHGQLFPDGSGNPPPL